MRMLLEMNKLPKQSLTQQSECSDIPYGSPNTPPYPTPHPSPLPSCLAADRCHINPSVTKRIVIDH